MATVDVPSPQRGRIEVLTDRLVGGRRDWRRRAVFVLASASSLTSLSAAMLALAFGYRSTGYVLGAISLVGILIQYFDLYRTREARMRLQDRSALEVAPNIPPDLGAPVMTVSETIELNQVEKLSPNADPPATAIVKNYTLNAMESWQVLVPDRNATYRVSILPSDGSSGGTAVDLYVVDEATRWVAVKDGIPRDEVQAVAKEIVLSFDRIAAPVLDDEALRFLKTAR